MVLTENNKLLFLNDFYLVYVVICNYIKYV